MRSSILVYLMLLLCLAPAVAIDDPARAHVAWVAGMAQWKEGDSNLYPQVAASFRRALAADPQNPDYHSYLGRILLDLGEIAEASAELRWCLGFHPRSTLIICTTHLAQGQCWELRGQPEKARIEYKKALATRPGQALAEEITTRLQVADWPRAVHRDCVLVYPPSWSESAATAAAATCEATVEHAVMLAHVTLSHPIVIYAVGEASILSRLGVHLGDAVEGRQQLYELTSGDVASWQPTLIRIVSYHIATTHSTDPVIRYGLWNWLAQPDPSAITLGPAPTGGRPSLADLRRANTWDAAASSEATAFVQYLMKTYGADAFAAFWEVPASDRAANVAYHKSLQDLETEWLATLK